MPGMPRCCGWLSGKAPRAISVVTTGMPVSSASTRSSVRGAGADHAAADVQHRAARLEDQPGRLADLLGVRSGHRAGSRAGAARSASANVVCACSADLATSTSTGPGRPVRGDVERLGDRARDLGRVGDQEVVLGDRHRDAADVGLLEGVGADRAAPDLAGDGDDRDRVHVGVGERRHQVGRARARWWPCRRRPCRWRRRTPGRRGRRPARGGPGCGGSGGVHERVVRREDRAARDAEDVLGAGASSDLIRLWAPVTCVRPARSWLVILVSSLDRRSGGRANKKPLGPMGDEGDACAGSGGLSSRVACVRESANAWAHDAPRASPRSTQCASDPSIRDRHLGSWPLRRVRQWSDGRDPPPPAPPHAHSPQRDGRRSPALPCCPAGGCLEPESAAVVATSAARAGHGRTVGAGPSRASERGAALRLAGGPDRTARPHGGCGSCRRPGARQRPAA